MKKNNLLVELSQKLEEEINVYMDEFNKLGKEIKELNQKVAEMHHQMFLIVKDLEPVESLVGAQKPELVPLFAALKEEFERPECDELQ